LPPRPAASPATRSRTHRGKIQNELYSVCWLPPLRFNDRAQAPPSLSVQFRVQGPLFFPFRCVFRLPSSPSFFPGGPCFSRPHFAVLPCLSCWIFPFRVPPPRREDGPSLLQARSPAFPFALRSPLKMPSPCRTAVAFLPPDRVDFWRLLPRSPFPFWTISGTRPAFPPLSLSFSKSPAVRKTATPRPLRAPPPPPLLVGPVDIPL